MNDLWDKYNFSAIFNDPRMWSEYKYIRNEGTWNNEGEWEGSISNGTFKAIIDTATEADVEMLPQGDKITDAISIISDTELFMSEKDHLADLVEYKDDNYKVSREREFNWNLHYYIALRQDENK